MRSLCGGVLAGLLSACLAGCLQTDQAYWPVSLPWTYRDVPDAPPGTTIEAGMPITLNMRQQEAAVTAVTQWLKEPETASFGRLEAVKASRGQIVVCGEVNGRNPVGDYPGMALFVGVMVGGEKPEFIVVSIAQAGPPRDDVHDICFRSGIFL